MVKNAIIIILTNDICVILLYLTLNCISVFFLLCLLYQIINYLKGSSDKSLEYTTTLGRLRHNLNKNIKSTVSQDKSVFISPFSTATIGLVGVRAKLLFSLGEKTACEFLQLN